MGVGERVTRISLKNFYTNSSLSLSLSSFTIESFPPLLSTDNSYLAVERLPIPETIKEKGEGESKKVAST